VKDDGKFEDAARDSNLALICSVKAFMTSSLTHHLLLSCRNVQCTRRNVRPYTPAGNNQLSLVFEPACAQVCIIVPTTTAHLRFCNVSTYGRGRYRWQLRSGQSAYTMNSHVKSVPSWSCLERLQALPKAVQGHCEVHCQPLLLFCRHLRNDLDT